MTPGHPERIDYEYVRNGTCNVFIASEPLRGWRMAEVRETKTAKALMNKVDFVYPPKHGSWLNGAKIELNVFSGQCLK